MDVSGIFDLTGLIPGWQPLNPYKCTMGKYGAVSNTIRGEQTRWLH